jgi:hypothetical protein
MAEATITMTPKELERLKWLQKLAGDVQLNARRPKRWA